MGTTGGALGIARDASNPIASNRYSFWVSKTQNYARGTIVRRRRKVQPTATNDHRSYTMHTDGDICTVVRTTGMQAHANTRSQAVAAQQPSTHHMAEYNSPHNNNMHQRAAQRANSRMRARSSGHSSEHRLKSRTTNASKLTHTQARTHTAQRKGGQAKRGALCHLTTCLGWTWQLQAPA